MGKVHEYDIVSSLHKGDMVHVFNTWWRKLCYFAEGFVGSRTDAEDLATDALTKLYFKKNDFDNIEDIGGFLYQTVRFSCFSLLKHRKIVNKHVKYEHIHGEDSEDYINARIVETEVIASICQLVECLPEERRKIFKLIFVEGLTTSEIATELRISVDTVRVQKARALQFLRKSLGRITS